MTARQRVITQIALRKADARMLRFTQHMLHPHLADQWQVEHGALQLRVLSADLQQEFAAVAADIEHVAILTEIMQ